MALTAQEMKEKERASWSGAAPVWEREDAWLAANSAVVGQKMIEAAGITAGMRVLDVACGTGEPGLSAAKVVGPTGAVVGTDISEEMLRVARAKAAREGLANISFHLGDGESLDGIPGLFDAATIRWGVMFMPDPTGCLRSVRKLLKPGARLAIATWDAPQRNPWFSTLTRVLRRHFDVPAPPPDAPGVFALADEARVRRVFEEAGFRDLEVESLAFAMRYRSPDHYWTVQTDVAAPIRDLLGRQPEQKVAEVRREAVVETEMFRSGAELEFPAATWIGAGAA